MYKSHLEDIDLDSFELKFIELEINSVCNISCSYCFRNMNEPDMLSKFTRWDDLLDMLKDMNISSNFLVGLSTGELFIDSEVDLVYTAIKKINRIKRFKEVDISYRIYSNGTNPKNILEFMDNISQDTNITLSISYDGENGNRRYPSDINMPKNLIDIASSKYAKDIIVRTAIYDYDFDRVLIWLYNIGFRNLEYYVLLDDSIYRDEKFLSRFRTRMINVITFFKDKEVLYNINKFYNRTNATSQCDSYGLCIKKNGYITICQHLAKYGNLSYDMTDIADKYKDLFIEFKNSYEDDRSTWRCKTCRNVLCEDCCSMRAISGDENAESRKYQQCRLRDIEMEVYESILGKREDV